MKNKYMTRKEEAREERVASSRLDESRAFETRAAEERTFEINVDPLHIPKSWIPEGYTYHWVRASTQGFDDIGRQVEAKRMGWTVVPASRHPQMSFSGLLSKGNDKDHIEYKGSILCERLTRDCERETSMYERLNYEKITSLPGMENLMGDSQVPFINRSETAIGRSRTL